MILEHNYEALRLTDDITTIAPPNYPRTYPIHWHNQIEIIFLPEDAAISAPPKLLIQDTLYELQPGDVLFVWPGDLHEIVENHDKKLCAIQFVSGLISEQPDFVPLLNQFRSIHHIAYEEATGFLQNFSYQAKQIFTIDEKKDNFYRIHKLMCLFEMLMELVTYGKENHRNQNNLAHDYSGQTLSKIQEACEYISDNCEQDLSLDILAEYTNFSPSYFSRIFKRATGYSFVEYLALQRIKKAQLLLSDFSISITDVSYQAGFKSIATFNRVFREHKGCSPSEYRKYYTASNR